MSHTTAGVIRRALSSGRYEPRTKPYAHQEQHNKHFAMLPFAAIFAEQGTGKTKMAIDTGGYQFAAGLIDAVFIIAPSGVHLNWTRIEIPTHGPEEAFVYEWKTDLTPRQRALLAERAVEDGPRRMRFLVMNIEAVRTADGARLASAFLRKWRTLMVVDESTGIKNHKALQTKAVTALGKLAVSRRIMTGTPIARDPLDFFSQIRFLHEKAMPWSSFTAFKATFSIQVTQQMGPRSFNKIIGFRNLPQLVDAIRPFTYRITKKECLDLPEKIRQTRFTPLSPTQAQRYKTLKNQGILELTEQERTGVVTTTSVLSVLQKLRQVTLGFVRDDTGADIPIPDASRIGFLMEDIEAIAGKVVIYTTHVWAITNIVESLSREYGPESVVHYYGATKDEERVTAVHRFQNDDACRFFVTNKTGAKGLTLTAASTMIFYSNDTSIELRPQAEDRIHRNGQKNECLYIDYIAPGTVDLRIMEILQGKRKLSDEIMVRDWRELIETADTEA